MNGPGPAELSCRRNYFYVGGHYADDGTGTGQHIMKEQMFVEHLEPLSGSMRPCPLVFLHGNVQTGSVSLPCPTHSAPLTLPHSLTSCRTGLIPLTADQAGHLSSSPEATSAISSTKPFEADLLPTPALANSQHTLPNSYSNGSPQANATISSPRLSYTHNGPEKV